MPEETTFQRYTRLQKEASEALQQLQRENEPLIGPDTEVTVYHTFAVYREMTIADLARQIREPVSKLIVDGSIKDAGAVVEHNSEWLHDESLEHWEADEDSWTVSLVK